MKAVECLIKVERGRGMLVDDALQKAAHGHADAAVNLKWWGMSDPHVNPVTHSTIESRIRAQNFCAGGDLYAGSLTEITYTGSGSRNTPAAAVDWWMHSARDRAIILSKGLYSEGIWAEWGSALDRSDFGSATYVVDFGTCGSGGG
ncbi:CAP domain-containing protein [Streptomyces sp. AK02-04a]|uniref:CAP domain-containing protein n=1 Tax=Streptomyces sp. AK02-04a TaxID=3028649 RepID=UPI0029B27224|nr:CAP domain-containing protein [Streptomyces sp. AK02-04a]MDX3755613.1 CAP domain-containing protein [Streptomyces sp. AK02-04a]